MTNAATGMAMATIALRDDQSGWIRHHIHSATTTMKTLR